MQTEEILELTKTSLADMKAEDMLTLNIKGMTSIADYLILCTARSSRHLKAIADDLLVKVKAQHDIPVKMNGENNSGWVVVDLGDIIIHIMSKEARSFYALEKLWQPNDK